MQKLDRNEIQSKIKALDGWKLEGDSIKKQWKFNDFSESIAFINKVADLAEEHDHHPELFNVYNQVSLSFSTHDAGGLTEKDFKIAKEIDQL